MTHIKNEVPTWADMSYQLSQALLIRAQTACSELFAAQSLTTSLKEAVVPAEYCFAGKLLVFEISVPNITWNIPLTFKRWVIIIYWFCRTRKEEFNVLLNEASVDWAQVTTFTVHAGQATKSVVTSWSVKASCSTESSPHTR